MRICVGRGSLPPRLLKRFWKTGTMKMIIAEKMKIMTPSTTDG